MGKGAGSPPPPPDPVATANAQATANADTARLQATLNRVNQTTPTGNLTYRQVNSDWVDQELAKRRDAFVPTPGGATAPAAQTWGVTGQNGDGQPEYGFITQPGGQAQGPSTFDEAAVRAELEKSNPFRDQWEAITSLSPNQQAILTEQEKLSLGLNKLAGDYTGRVSEATKDPFSLDQFGAAPKADDAARQRIEEALFSRLTPQFDRDEERMRTRLANQGIIQGSDAYNTEYGNFGQTKNDARMGAVLAGGQEQSRQFGLESTARQNAIAEALMARNQPINEIVALTGAGPGVQSPQFANVPQVGVAPTDVIGAQGLTTGANNAAYQARAQQAASGNSAGAGLLGAGMTAAAIFF